MRDGDRSACRDLFAEIRDDGAVGTEHITEAGGDELGAILVLRMQFIEERLHVNLCDTFAGTHDIGGVNRFVGRDHDEAFSLVFNRHVRHVLCSSYVSEDGFVRITLHERYMLVCCCVIDHVRTHFAEYLFDTGAVTHIGDNRNESCSRELLLQVECEVMER